MAEYIISSGELESGIILASDSMSVLDGGVATDTTVDSGKLYVSSGGAANSTTVNGYDGRLYVSSGGTANSTRVNSKGILIVSRGGVANSTTVTNYGSLYVSDGGIATDTTVDSGKLYVSSGGVANSTTVTNHGSLCVSDGGRANITTVNFGCGMDVHSGGTVNSTTVNGVVGSRGSLYVLGGGTANITTVNSGGYMCVRSGGTATVIVENGGYVDIEDGADVMFASNTISGLVISNSTSATVHSGTTVNSTTVQNGHLFVSSAGTLTGRIVGGDITGYAGATIDFDLTQTEPGAWARINDLTKVKGAWNWILTVDADQAEGIYTLAEGADGFDQTISVRNKVGDDLGTLMVGGTAAISGTDYFLSLSDDGRLSLKIGETVPTPPYTSDGLVLNSTTTVENGETFHDTLIFGSLCVNSGGTADITTVNGHLYISSGGVANSVFVNDRGSMYVSSGGSANSTTISRGYMYVSNGGLANSTAVYGQLYISSGGVANSVFVNDRGSMYVSSGGTATSIVENGGYVEIADGASASFVPNTFYGIVLSNNRQAIVHSGTTANSTTVDGGGTLYLSSGGVANSTTLDRRGTMRVSSGGTAINTTISSGSLNVSGGGVANSTTVSVGGWLIVSSGGTVNSTRVNSKGILIVSSGGTVNSTRVNSNGVLNVSSGGTVCNTTVSSGGSLTIDWNGKLTGKMTFGDGAKVSAADGAILDFDLTQMEAGATALVNDLSVIQGAPVYTLTVDADSWKPGSYTYSLAKGAENFASTITVVNTAGDELGELTVGETVRIGYDDYKLNLNDGALSVTIAVADLTPENPFGTADGLTWDGTGADAYVVELSTGESGNAFIWTTSSTAQDLYDLPGGTYQWRVKADANSDWAVGEAIVSENAPGAAKVLQSDGDDCDDLFFANPTDTWSRLYYAQHVGSLDEDGWTGTKEIVSANGKGRIQNLFFGSYDPNVLCLTDGENGDAIFLDDMYTELPEEIEANTARLLQIHEIRAGGGDDIVDMTSQQFAYLGGGQTIRGGDGNDVIWANTGANRLFGDAGDDRIVGASGNDVIAGGIGDDRLHGGGGDDTFTFCDNWGKDTVQQLETGFVTLWFASGDESNWDAEKLTYTDGENTVTVVGVTAEQVTLKFGDDGSARFASLANMGAFDDATSRKIFEAVLA